MNKLPDRHAVVIGIDDYRHGVPPLSSAVADARAIADALESDHGYDAVHLLLDADATSGGILCLLQETLPQSLGPDSGVVIYYAGHGLAEGDGGSPQGFLVPHDAHLDDKSTWLSMDGIRRALADLPCRHLLVVLDCCYAGSFRWMSLRSMVPTGRPLYDSQYNRYLQGTAWQVLTSASQNEKALDLEQDNRGEEAGHSPFAAALLRGLAGDADSSRGGHDADGVMTATELFQYVFEELVPPVEDWRQTPGLWPLKPDNTGEFLFLSPRQEKKTRPDPPLDDANNPWLGLRPYREDDALLFFGREQVIEELLERLRDPSRPLLAVVGRSGSGKSSLVRAGLLPRLRQPPEAPGDEAGAWTIVEAALQIDPLGQLDEAKRRFAEAGPRKLLVVDPFEDLFLADHDAVVQDDCLDRLRTLMTGADPVRVLLTVRSGFEARLKQSLEDLLAPASGDREAPGPYELPAPTLEELREIVEEPAKAKALYFEPGELIDELIDEVVALPGALPLLSLTLAQMYRRALERRRDWRIRDRALNRQDHKAVGGPQVALGGVAGTVHALADQLLKEAESAGLETTVRRGALRMVSFEGWRGVARRRVSRRELEYADPQEQEQVERVLDRLTAARLLVVDREHLEPVHDTLVREWRPMKSWLEEAGDEQLLLRSVWRAAEEWEAGGRGEGRLWVGDRRLPKLQILCGELNRLERQFVEASIRRTRRVEDNARVAVAGEWMAKDPTRAALVLAEISNPGETNYAISMMLEALGQPISHSILRGHEEAVVSAVFNAAGTKVVTASVDHTARIWDAGGIDKPRVFRGHKGNVNSATFNSDGTRIVTASYDMTARVWNVDCSGEPVVLHGHAQRVWRASFNSAGTKVVTASDDGTARLWNSDGSGKPVVLSGHEKRVTLAAFNPDDTRILTASEDGTARVWNSKGSSEPVILRGHEDLVWYAAFNASGTKIVTASHDKTARVWDVDGSGEPVVLRGHDDVVFKAAFSTDGSRVVTASRDGTARVWNEDGSGKPVILRGQGSWMLQATFNADGTRIITCSKDGTARVWNADGFGQPVVLRGHEGHVPSAQFNAAGTRVVTASGDRTVRVWGVDGLGVLRGHRGEVWAASFNTHSTKVVTASEDGTGRVWNIEDFGQPLVLQGHGSNVLSASFNAAGTKVVTASADRTARIWDIDDADGGTLRKPVVLRGHKHGLYSATFNTDGTKVVTASADHTARIWNVDGSGEPFVLLGHKDHVGSAVFSDDSMKILTTSLDRTARVWNVEGSVKPVVLRGHGDSVISGAFSADGTKVVTTCGYRDPAVRVWNVDEPGEPVVLQGHQNGVRSAAFNAAGTKIVSASGDLTARVWEVDGSGVPVVLRGHTEALTSAAFNPSGTQVVTASEDGTARVWNVDGSGNPVVLRGHSGTVVSAAFNADGTKVVTASFDGTARVWTIDPASLQAAIRSATSACLDPEFRTRNLGEPRELAWKKYAECELGYGRYPEAYFFDTEDPESAERFLSQLSKQARNKYEELREASTPKTRREP